MSDAFTSSEWMLESGDPSIFLAAFETFLKSGARYADGMEGTIYRDAEDPRRFIVLCHWMNKDGLLRWHGSTEYDHEIESVFAKGAVLTRDGVLMHKAADVQWLPGGDFVPIRRGPS